MCLQIAVGARLVCCCGLCQRVSSFHVDSSASMTCTNRSHVTWSLADHIIRCLFVAAHMRCTSCANTSKVGDCCAVQSWF